MNEITQITMGLQEQIDSLEERILALIKLQDIYIDAQIKAIATECEGSDKAIGGRLDRIEKNQNEFRRKLHILSLDMSDPF